jgi:hypothetical protein
MPALVLLRRFWRVGLELVAVVAIILLAHGLQRQGERQAVARDQIARLTREKRTLDRARAVQRVEYIARRNTVLVRATRYDTLRIENRITDTVWVKATLAAGDATVQSCRLLVTSCEARGRIDSLTIANRDSTIVATRALLPTRADRVRGAAKWAAIGYAAAKAVQLLTH